MVSSDEHDDAADDSVGDEDDGVGADDIEDMIGKEESIGSYIVTGAGPPLRSCWHCKIAESDISWMR